MDTTALVITDAPHLTESAARWCAALGIDAETTIDGGQIRSRWRQAPVVLVGADQLASLARGSHPRRRQVLAVADPDDPDLWRLCVELGVEAVLDPSDEDRLIDVLAAALDGGEEACLVAVVGAVGGVGASTFAAGTALSAARRDLRTLLLDVDRAGGGLDLVLGAERTEGARWADLADAEGRISPSTLVDVLPVHRGVSLLTWGRDDASAAHVSTAIEAGRRGFDLVVADLPRRPDAAAREVLARAVLTVLLVPEDVRGVAAGRIALSELSDLTATVVVLPVARRGGLGRAGVAGVVAAPQVRRLRPDRQLRIAVDQGRGPGRSRRLRRSADAVLDLLGLGA